MSNAPARLEAHLQLDPDSSVSPRWRDLTPYLLLNDDSLITITRGRDDEGGEVTAGTCTFTLDNSTGEFTPGRSSSSFYPHITTDKGVRVRFAESTGNLVTGDSSTGEAGVGYWAAFFGSATVTSDATRAWQGTKSIKVAYNGDAGPLATMVYPGDFVIGKTYTASVYVYVPTGTGAIRLNSFDWSGSATTTLTNQWQRISVTFTVPTNWSRTDGLNFCVGWATANATTGQAIWFDGFMVNEGSSAATFTTTAYNPSERFTGYSSQWLTEWPGGSDFCVTRVSSSDKIARLQTTIFDSMGVEQLRTPGPSTSGSYLPFVIYPLDDDGKAATAHDASGYGRVAAVVGTRGSGGGDANNAALGWQAGDPPPGLHNCASFYSMNSGVNHTYLRASWSADPLGELGWAYDHTLFVAFKTTDTQAGTLIRLEADSGTALAIEFDGTGKVVGKAMYGNGTVNLTRTSASTYHDGNWHTACLCWTGSSSQIALWMDGTSQGTLNYSPAFYFGPSHNNVYIGGHPNGLGVRATLACAGVLYGSSGTPTSTPNADFANAVRVGHINDTSTTRVGRYLDYARVPSGSAWRSSGTPYEDSIDVIDIYGMSAWEAIQRVATTEGGAAFVYRDGRFRMDCRYDKFNRAVTVSVDQLNISKDVQFVVDNQQYVNRVTATSPSVGTYIAEHTDDIPARGTYSRELELATTVWDHIKARADWELSLYGDQPVRIKNVALDILTATSATGTAIQAVDINHWIEVTGLDTGTAPAASLQFVCEGYTEVLGWNQWGITLNTSPALTLSLLVLNDATRGTTDSTNRLGY